MNTLISKECIQLIKSDRKDIYNVKIMYILRYFLSTQSVGYFRRIMWHWRLEW